MIEKYINDLIDFLLNNPEAYRYPSYVIIFVSSLFESTPFFGFLIPGMVIVIASGFIVKLGILDIFDTIIIASLGAILGDMIGFYLGKKYGENFFIKYGKYFLIKRKHFEKTKEIMNKHTGKALILGRFNSLTRAFAPFVAGSSNVEFKKFMKFNISGGFLWGTSLVLLGILFGASFEVAVKYIGKVSTAILVLAILLFFVYKAFKKSQKEE